jgi:leucyl/phenylalanyl-tRNA---protein transferase
MPIEPPPTPWVLPSPSRADDQGLVAIGADLEPGTLLAAYRSGLFPMPFGRRRVGWWSPDPRGVLPLDQLRVSRSLRRSCARFEIRHDTAFETVMRRCADPRRPHGWINEEFVRAYTRLHELGWAHSVETWLDGALVGGLYGIRIGGLFAGESMFHSETDASKVALVALVQHLHDTDGSLLDVQWRTDHLATLGVVDIRRDDYLRRLAAAV